MKNSSILSLLVDIALLLAAGILLSASVALLLDAKAGAQPPLTHQLEPGQRVLVYCGARSFGADVNGLAYVVAVEEEWLVLSTVSQKDFKTTTYHRVNLQLVEGITILPQIEAAKPVGKEED